MGHYFFMGTCFMEHRLRRLSQWRHVEVWISTDYCEDVHVNSCGGRVLVIHKRDTKHETWWQRYTSQKQQEKGKR